MDTFADEALRDFAIKATSAEIDELANELNRAAVKLRSHAREFDKAEVQTRALPAGFKAAAAAKPKALVATKDGPPATSDEIPPDVQAAIDGLAERVDALAKKFRADSRQIGPEAGYAEPAPADRDPFGRALTRSDK